MMIDPSGFDEEPPMVRIGESTIYAEERSATKIEMPWGIRMKGGGLTKLEYTQYVSAETKMWDEKGKALSKEKIYQVVLYREGRDHPSIDPFAKDVQDQGFYTGNGDWNKITEKSISKDGKIETLGITDMHTHAPPAFRYEKEGTEKGVYAQEVKIDAVLKIRDSKTKAIVASHKWGYVLKNFAGDDPKSPVTSGRNYGIYAAYGIADVYFDMRKKTN